MSASTFVDTNVFVYLFDDDVPEQQRRAADVLDAESATELVVSAEVLGELYVTLSRKLARPYPPEVAARAVEEVARLRTVSTDQAMVRAAIDTSRRSRISYWDALIVEAASSAGCGRLLTEDLDAGQVIRGVEVVNPF